MNQYDWKSNIKTNITMLRLLGLWPKGEAYTLGFYMLHVALIMSILLLAHITTQAVNLYYIRHDLAAITGTVYILLVEMLVVFKVYYVINNMGMLKQLLQVLETEMFQPKNSVQVGEIESSIWYWRVIYKTFLFMCFSANFFWMVYPLLDKTEGQERKLPFFAWYPYDTRKTPMYEITYVYQICSVAFITTVHINIDALVAALNVFNGSQFDILADNLRNLHRLGENISLSFVNCVKHHREILSYADRSNKFLNWILFLQFFVSGFTIGITMFQLTVVPLFSNVFFSLFLYGMGVTSQNFMYCWFGNEIQVKSEKILYAAFECEWFDFPEDVKKELLYFLIRAQQPVKLSALNLFYLSLDTFMKILKTSWSYFALLHQMSS